MPVYYCPAVSQGSPYINSGLNFVSGRNSVSYISSVYPSANDGDWMEAGDTGADAGTSFGFSPPSLLAHEYVTGINLLRRNFFRSFGSAYSTLGLTDQGGSPWPSDYVSGTFAADGTANNTWLGSPTYTWANFPVIAAATSSEESRIGRIRAGWYLDGVGTTARIRLGELNLQITTAYLDTQNTSPPTISGPARRTKPFTANPGSWNRNGGSFIYQWYRWNGSSWVSIPGATGSSYTPTNSDVGTQLYVLVGAVNQSGNYVYSGSAATNVISGYNPITTII